jgi:AbrB family looped-hinge helix DNA binding protein
METAVLSSKGQIVIPKPVRDSHRWEPGTQFTVEDTGDAVVLRPVKAGRVTRLEDVAGSLKYDGPPISIDDMNAAIEAEVLARHARGRY